jgi:MoxR-like ATPase
VEEIKAARQAIEREISKRIVGQKAVIEQMLVSLLSRGHSLFVGVPGLAKTLIVSTLARCLSLRFNRIQFTPDLTPSDITGSDVLQEDVATGRRSFTFMKGPIFCNVLLADEVNRTPPKTQAALLQAMQERQVSAGGSTYDIEPPFLVFATENPIEHEGTYPLPEAQLDRFMLSIRVEYPSAEEEALIVRATTSAGEPDVRAAVGPAELIRYQDLVRKVPVSDSVVRYAVRLARSTRPASQGVPDVVRRYVAWGAGPRASQFLVLGAKARALLDGRPTPGLEDVRAVARPVLLHRVVLNFQAEADRVPIEQIVEHVVLSTPED